MFNKQIDNVRFKELKNNKMEITYPDNAKYRHFESPIIINFEQGLKKYKIMFAAKYADKVFDEVIDELELDIETAHLFTSKDVIIKDGKALWYKYANGYTVKSPDKIFNVYMERALNIKGIDLSFMSTVTDKYKVKISGNAGAIAWEYRDFLFNTPWKEYETDKNKLREYLQSHKHIVVLEEANSDRRKVDINKLLETKFGTESTHHGYGSQASVHLKTIKLKADKDGNTHLPYCCN